MAAAVNQGKTNRTIPTAQIHAGEDTTMYKRMNFRLVVVLAVLLIFGITPKNSSQELPQVFSAAGQFSLTQNPNGTWSYGFTEGLGGPFTLYTVNGNGGPGGPTQPEWFGPFFGGFPLVDTNLGAQSLNYFILHPAVPNLYSVVRWTAPTSGEFDLLGLFLGVAFATTDVHVLKNGASVFDGQNRLCGRGRNRWLNGLRQHGLQGHDYWASRRIKPLWKAMSAPHSRRAAQAAHQGGAIDSGEVSASALAAPEQ